MSRLDHKLEHFEPTPGRARRKLNADKTGLSHAFRYEVIEGDRKRPNRVAIKPMETRSIWRRISPYVKGDADFELESEEKTSE